MEKSSYQKLRQKMWSIEKWIIITEDKWKDFDDPTAKMLMKHLKELKKIIYEKDNDRAS